MLRFQVQGSSETPYRITAEGSGGSFRMYCSCPAGRNGGGFCKHRQALLLGLWDKLVQPSDDPVLLKDMMIGSALALKAQTHVPASGLRSPPPFTTIVDAYEALREPLLRRFVRVECATDGSPEPNRAAETLNCYGTGKSGRVLKDPVLSLEYIPEIADVGYTEAGEEVLINPRPRAKPFRVTARDVRPSPTFTTFERAFQKFADLAGI